MRKISNVLRLNVRLQLGLRLPAGEPLLELSRDASLKSVEDAVSQASASTNSGGAYWSCKAVMLSSPVLKLFRSLRISFLSSHSIRTTFVWNPCLYGTVSEVTQSICSFFAFTHCLVVTLPE